MCPSKDKKWVITWKWSVKTSQCFHMHQFTKIRVTSQWLMVETYEPSEMSELIKIQLYRTLNDKKRPPRSHDMTMTVLDRTSQIVIFDCHCDIQNQAHEKCWKHQNQVNKSGCALGITKNGPCKGQLWLNSKCAQKPSQSFSTMTTVTSQWLISQENKP